MTEQNKQAEPKRLLDFSGTPELAEARESVGRVVVIDDERGESMDDVTMTIVGTLSSQYRKAQEKQRQRWANTRTKPTGEDLNRDALELLAACVTGWSGIVDGEEPVPCTKKNVMKLLDDAPWIREQITSATQDHAAFFTNSSSG